jgi:hypothetical protein
MASTPEIKSCKDVDERLLDDTFAPESGEGLRPRERVLRLLERMARVAAPGAAAHRILEVTARLCSTDWLGGPLDVVIRDFGLATEIELRIDQGSRFERVRVVSLAVPLAELAEWAVANPSALLPLAVFGTPSAVELRLRKVRATVPAPSERDPHRIDTARVPGTSVPREALRSIADADGRPTIPAPRPDPVGVQTKKDPTDEGWDG